MSSDVMLMLPIEYAISSREVKVYKVLKANNII